MMMMGYRGEAKDAPAAVERASNAATMAEPPLANGAVVVANPKANVPPTPGLPQGTPVRGPAPTPSSIVPTNQPSEAP